MPRHGNLGGAIRTIVAKEIPAEEGACCLPCLSLTDPYRDIREVPANGKAKGRPFHCDSKTPENVFTLMFVWLSGGITYVRKRQSICGARTVC